MADPRQLYAQALDAFDRGHWRPALQLAGQVARLAPRHAGSRYIAGAAALQLGELPIALRALREAAALAPQRLDVLAQYARALTVAGNPSEAVAVARSAWPLAELREADAVSCDTLGTVFSRAQLHEEAARASRRAVELAPRHPGYRFNLATSLMFAGEFDGAARECDACLALAPHFWRAHVTRAQLRRHTPTDNHVPELERLVETHPDADAQLHLRLALAKELEDLGEYPRAFAQYAAGKAAHGRRIDYDPKREEAGFAAIIDAWETVAQAPDAPPGHPSSEPIFVVGMPRSGTTLVDRVLSAHPQVHAAGELDAFDAALWHATAGRRTHPPGTVMDALRAEPVDWARLGRDYVERTRPATGHTPHFTDKLPHNFLHLGFIARALPNARIVLVRRNPLDTCLGNLRQLFAIEARRFDYSYDLLDIGRYFVQFHRLVEHWKQVLPGRIVEVAYEDLVLDQATTTRTLLEACGLEWNEAVLQPEQGAGWVSTASAVQVRSAVNADSLRRWKRFEPQLGELRRLLDQNGVAID